MSNELFLELVLLPTERKQKKVLPDANYLLSLNIFLVHQYSNARFLSQNSKTGSIKYICKAKECNALCFIYTYILRKQSKYKEILVCIRLKTQIGTAHIYISGDTALYLQPFKMIFDLLTAYMTYSVRICCQKLSMYHTTR